MTKTDLYLEFQKESGVALTTIKDALGSPDVAAYCSSCNETAEAVTELPELLEQYIEWLESMAICYFLSGDVKKKFDKAIEHTHGTQS